MKKELTHKEVASRGGKATVKKYGKRQMKEWGKQGGRPKNMATDMVNPLSTGNPINELT